MKQNTLIRKVAYASLTLFISAPHVVTAMDDILPIDILQKPVEKQASSGQLRNHEYYKAELQKLAESTRRIHEEVDRILKEFRENIRAVISKFIKM